MSELKKKQLAFLIADYLKQEMDAVKHDDQKESLEVCFQCLETTYGFQLDDATDRKAFLVAKGGLMNMFENQLRNEKDAELPEATAEDKRKAEEFKNKANSELQNGYPEKAIALYTEAVKLDSKCPIFYVNRAAAYSKLLKWEEAIADCNEGIKLDPNYSKAHSRLGTCYYNLKNYDEALKSFETALNLDPSVEVYKKNVEKCRNSIEEDMPLINNNNSNPSPNLGAGGIPGMPPGMPDLSALLNNPQFSSMAQQMMQNPDFMNIAQSMMGGMGGGRPQ